MNAARKNPIFLKINVYHSRSTNLICKNIIGGIGGTEFTMAKNKLSLADLSRQRKKVLEEIDGSPPNSNFTEIESSQTNESQTIAPPNSEVTSEFRRTEPTIQFKNEDEVGENGKRSPQVETTESTLTVNRNPDINHSPVEIEVSEETKGPGRPKSLRSDPNYETTTIFLHRGTKAKARYHLATQEQKQDLQVLINDLLEDWVTKREQNSANI